jgi:hypothetical protein
VRSLPHGLPRPGNQEISLDATADDPGGPDNITVRTKLATTLTDHGMQIPQLLILELSNDIAVETDLTFIRQ